MKEVGEGLMRGKYLALSCMVLWSSSLFGQGLRGIVVAEPAAVVLVPVDRHARLDREGRGATD